MKKDWVEEVGEKEKAAVFHTNVVRVALGTQIVEQRINSEV